MHNKSSLLVIKIYWIQFQLIGLTKIEDFKYFLLKILPPQKIVPSKSCFLFEYECSFFFYCMLFCLHCIIQICLYTATMLDNFDKKSSDRNCLKSWWVTYLKINIINNWRVYNNVSRNSNTGMTEKSLFPPKKKPQKMR